MQGTSTMLPIPLPLPVLPDPTALEALEALERDLTRGVLSIICRSTGRRRTPDERRRLDALVSEIHDVRHARREAARREAARREAARREAARRS